MNIVIDFLNKSGIATGVIAGIVAAIVQLLISHLEHTFIIKSKKADQAYTNNEWYRNEIQKLIIGVTEIRIPAITETSDTAFENTYHLIFEYYERAKSLLDKQIDFIIIKSYFSLLDSRYKQMQNIKSGHEKELNLEDSKRVFIDAISECKKRLLAILDDSIKEITSKMR